MIRFGKVVSDAHAIVGDGSVGADKICSVRLRARETKTQVQLAFWKGRNGFRE